MKQVFWSDDNECAKNILNINKIYISKIKLYNIYIYIYIYTLHTHLGTSGMSKIRPFLITSLRCVGIEQDKTGQAK